jgi:S-formylglutathione hydrolase FrmB
MAQITLSHKSAVLGKRTSASILLPDALTGEPLPVLYLLHGLSHDSTDWLLNTSLGRYHDGKNLIVVMPDGSKSFYVNMVHGLNYYDYIAGELPEYIENMLPAIRKREGRFVAGLSMGGYGAFLIALSKPNRYKAAASFSGVLDIAETVGRSSNAARLFGDKPDFRKHDLFALAKKAARLKVKPALYQWCGTEDPLYDENVKFRELAKTLNLEYEYAEGPGGHTWACWDEQIEAMLGRMSRPA